MRNLGFWEILLIGLVVVLIFGAGRLPQLGKSIGEGIRGFKEAIKGGEKGEATEKK